MDASMDASCWRAHAALQARTVSFWRPAATTQIDPNRTVAAADLAGCGWRWFERNAEEHQAPCFRFFFELVVPPGERPLPCEVNRVLESFNIPAAAEPVP